MMSDISPGSIVCSFLVMDAIEHGEDCISYQAYDTTSDTPVKLVQLVGAEDESALFRRAQALAVSSAEPARVVSENGIVAVIYGLPSVERAANTAPELPTNPAMVEMDGTPVLPPMPDPSRPPSQGVVISKKYYGFIGAGAILLLGYFLWPENGRKSHEKAAPHEPSVELPAPPVSEKKTQEKQEEVKPQPKSGNKVTKTELYEKFNILVQREYLQESVTSIGQEMQQYVTSVLESLSKLQDKPGAWEDAAIEESNRSAGVFTECSERIRKMYMEAIDKVLHEVQGAEDEMSSDEWGLILADYCRELESERDEALKTSVEQWSDRLKDEMNLQREEVQRLQGEHPESLNENNGDNDEEDEEDEEDDEVTEAEQSLTEGKLAAQTDNILEALEDAKERITDSLSESIDSKSSVWDKKMLQAKGQWKTAVKLAKKKLKDMGDLLEHSGYGKPLSAERKKALLHAYIKRGNERIEVLTHDLTQEVRRLESEHRESIQEERRSRSEGKTNYPFRRAEFRRL